MQQVDLRKNPTQLSKPPLEGAELAARVTVHQFIAKVSNSAEQLGFGELVETSRAVARILATGADAKLLELYNSELVPEPLRRAVQSAADLADAIEGVRRGIRSATLKAFKDEGSALIKRGEERINGNTLPPECKLYDRYRIAAKAGAETIPLKEFAQRRLSGRDALAAIALLVELAEVGRPVTKRHLERLNRSELDGEVARAKRAVAVGVSSAPGEGEQGLHLLNPGEVRTILDYARRHGGEQAVGQTAQALGHLGAYAESPNLVSRVETFMTHLAALAAHDAKLVAARNEGILGIERVLHGCLQNLDQMLRSSTHSAHDRNAVAALNGFGSEAAVACRLVQQGHQVRALDEVVRLPGSERSRNGPLVKEIDIDAMVRAGSVSVRILLEVKSSAAALAQSFERYGERQLLQLARVASASGATAGLVINEAGALPADLTLALNDVISRVRERTNRHLVVTDAQLQPIPGVQSSNNRQARSRG